MLHADLIRANDCQSLNNNEATINSWCRYSAEPTTVFIPPKIYKRMERAATRSSRGPHSPHLYVKSQLTQ